MWQTQFPCFIVSYSVSYTTRRNPYFDFHLFDCHLDRNFSVQLGWLIRTFPSSSCVSWDYKMLDIRWEYCSVVLSSNSYINDLVQDCSNSSALAMDLLQPCAKPSPCNKRSRNSGRQDVVCLTFCIQYTPMQINCIDKQWPCISKNISA